MLKVKLIVQGRVQGVGFRYMTKIVADQIGVYGLVRNQPDGSVYIEANGNETNIKTFINAVKKSPSPSGRVDRCQVIYDDSLEIRDKFKVT